MTEPWKPQHNRGIAPANRTNLEWCIFCKLPWPCPGAYGEMRQVLEEAENIFHVEESWLSDRDDLWQEWREQELLPILAAGE